MDEHEWLATRFEENRNHLRAVAYRMLGSLSEADDALQESWLHVSRADTSAIKNLGGWLTTVVARVCLDLLRARKSRSEDSLNPEAPAPKPSESAVDPELEALQADSVGIALLVVLETLEPAERLAFVLHDLFDLSFDEIAPLVGRSSEATRQLASRARRRVRGGERTSDAERSAQRGVVNAFLAAARGGDLKALLAVLDADVVLRADRVASPADGGREMRGATIAAERAIKGGARWARPALVDGVVGVVVAPRGRLWMVLALTITDGKVRAIEAIAEPERLARMEISVLD